MGQSCFSCGKICFRFIKVSFQVNYYCRIRCCLKLAFIITNLLLNTLNISLNLNFFCLQLNLGPTDCTTKNSLSRDCANQVLGSEALQLEIVCNLGHSCKELVFAFLEVFHSCCILILSSFQLSPDRKSTRLNSSHVRMSYAV